MDAWDTIIVPTGATIVPTISSGSIATQNTIGPNNLTAGSISGLNQTAGSFRGGDLLKSDGLYLDSANNVLNLNVSGQNVVRLGNLGGGNYGLNVLYGTISGTTISGSTISGGTITGTTITGSFINGNNITANTITSGQIAQGTITGFNIAGQTISGSNIINGTITNAQIAGGTITGSQIASSTISGSNIAGGTITGSNIANGTISGANIAGGTITGAQISGGTITGANIAGGTITGDKIGAQQIGAYSIASHAITADLLNVTTLSAITGNMGSLVSGTITSGTINSGTINSSTINGGTINGTTITGSYIQTAAAPTDRVDMGYINGMRFWANGNSEQASITPAPNGMNIVVSSCLYVFHNPPGFQSNARLWVDGDAYITGTLSATTKNFDIPHPTKPNMRLRYTSTESPEVLLIIRGSGDKPELPQHFIDITEPETVEYIIGDNGKGGKSWIAMGTRKGYKDFVNEYSTT